MSLFGKSAGQRGLAKLAGLVLGTYVEKGDPEYWAEFEQGKDAQQLSEFSQQSLRFAAVEAHATLQIWRALQERVGNLGERLKSEASVSSDGAAQPRDAAEL